MVGSAEGPIVGFSVGLIVGAEKLKAVPRNKIDINHRTAYMRGILILDRELQSLLWWVIVCKEQRFVKVYRSPQLNPPKCLFQIISLYTFKTDFYMIINLYHRAIE